MLTAHLYMQRHSHAQPATPAAVATIQSSPPHTHPCHAGAGNDSRSLNVVMTELQPTLDM